MRKEKWLVPFSFHVPSFAPLGSLYLPFYNGLKLERGSRPRRRSMPTLMLSIYRQSGDGPTIEANRRDYSWPQQPAGLGHLDREATAANAPAKK